MHIGGRTIRTTDDRDVDASDLAAWEASFGQTSNPAAELTAAPPEQAAKLAPSSSSSAERLNAATGDRAATLTRANMSDAAFAYSLSNDSDLDSLTLVRRSDAGGDDLLVDEALGRAPIERVYSPPVRAVRIAPRYPGANDLDSNDLTDDGAADSSDACQEGDVLVRAMALPEM